MTVNRALLFAGSIVLLAIACSVWVYPQAPAQIPTHWDGSGNINGHMPKLWGIWIWPVLLAVIGALLWVSPVISPKGFKFEQSANVFNLVVVSVMAVVFVADIVVIRAAVGQSLTPNILLLVIGMLFFIAGNYMGKIGRNFFIGVRTPWTLASDEVWLRTQRFTGRMLVPAGLVIIILGFESINKTIPILLLVAILVIAPALYSYLVYRKIERLRPRT